MERGERRILITPVKVGGVIVDTDDYRSPVWASWLRRVTPAPFSRRSRTGSTRFGLSGSSYRFESKEESGSRAATVPVEPPVAPPGPLDLAGSDAMALLMPRPLLLSTSICLMHCGGLDRGV
ncbi:hypothetical protein EYF80_015022 [Liparis tanakae]|uniref:Uncharacterized protein n=1 Tax=Liparis tanakae TaxID=230148 RepID=A0A4Z2IBI4_9TELE|nr:hypothetical protein EYF80_015022 [Liparis tanakae]